MILADTGYFLALANAVDDDHPAAVAATRRLKEGLVTTWPVLTETTHLLAARLGTRALLAFVASARAGAFEQYADLPMDLADASLVVAAEERGDGRILSVDRRAFLTYRWKNRKPFRNLLLR